MAPEALHGEKIDDKNLSHPLPKVKLNFGRKQDKAGVRVR
jgi:hypothetical protein